MPIYSSNFTQRAYFAPQTALRTIPNTSGTWTNTSAQQILYQSLTMTPGNPLVDPSYKTGTPSRLIGTRGRQTGTWQMTAPVIPSGTAGTQPNANLLFQAMFGAAPTIGGGSVAYGFATAIKPFLLLQYDESGLALPTHMYAMGALPQTVTFTLGGEHLMMNISGSSIGIGDKDNFTAYTGFDAALKGGLTTYPTEPTSPTTAGSPLSGWGGVLTIDGNVMGECRGTLSIEYTLGYEYIGDGYSDPYAIAVVPGARQVKLSNLQFINDDNTALQNIKQKAFLKTPMTVSIAHGNVAGSIVTFVKNNVQFPQGAFSDNGAAVDVKFDGAAAHASSVGVQDDSTIAFT